MDIVYINGLRWRGIRYAFGFAVDITICHDTGGDVARLGRPDRSDAKENGSRVAMEGGVEDNTAEVESKSEKEEAVQDDVEVTRVTATEKTRDIAVTALQKPFEVRERLRHEPPEMTCSKFEIHDLIQKKFKKQGGRELEWRTSWLDLLTEKDLIGSYYDWCFNEADQSTLSVEDKLFYDRLSKELAKEKEESDEAFSTHRETTSAENLSAMYKLLNKVLDAYAQTKR